MSDAVWQTQLNSLYAHLFARDPATAFANYRLWESAGYFTAYLMQSRVCLEIKLWTMSGLLASGVVGIAAVEAGDWWKRRRGGAEAMSSSL